MKESVKLPYKIAICASGPSLCRQDIEKLRKKQIPIITINSSWLMHTSCDFIFASDEAWWDKNFQQINSPAEKWTCSRRAAEKFNINFFDFCHDGTYNSGMVAILFAIHLGAKEIILLGYDCSLDKGIHWHGKHVGISNPTPYQVKRWISEFEIVKINIKDTIKITNCSRETKLSCFPISSLNKAVG